MSEARAKASAWCFIFMALAFALSVLASGSTNPGGVLICAGVSALVACYYLFRWLL